MGTGKNQEKKQKKTDLQTSATLHALHWARRRCGNRGGGKPSETWSTISTQANHAPIHLTTSFAMPSHSSSCNQTTERGVGRFFSGGVGREGENRRGREGDKITAMTERDGDDKKRRREEGVCVCVGGGRGGRGRVSAVEENGNGPANAKPGVLSVDRPILRGSSFFPPDNMIRSI